MAKNHQKIMLIFLFAVLFSSVFCVLTPSTVYAKKLSASEMGLSVLHDFFGLDLSTYNIEVEENSLSEPSLGNAVYESVFFSLTSKDSKIRLVFTFVNDNLQNMYVFENEGTPLFKSTIEDNAANVVGYAQSFLGQYEQYLSQPFFGNLESTLNGVVANKNYTKSFENAVLDVSVYDNNRVTNFMWYSTVETDVVGPNAMFVALGFKDGAIVSFTDTWTLNNGIDKTFRFLENDATVNTNIVNINNLSDVNFFDNDSVLSATGATGYFAALLIVVGVGGVFMIGLYMRERMCEWCSSFRRFFIKKKLFSLLFCLLIMFTAFLPIVGSVNALSPTGSGVVWGSRSSGASNDLHDSYSWRKTDSEISYQESVARFLTSNCLIAANGYAGFSNIWTNKSSILSQAQSLNAYYDHVAVFDWDHGVGGYPGTLSNSSYFGIPDDELHYMFEDDWGTLVGLPSDYTVDWSHGVYDVNIYETFSVGKVHFALINTCLSANIKLFGQGTSPSGYPMGMPFAFTHRIVGYVPDGGVSSLISDDGYNRPDAFPQCYIGFPYGSAALDQYIAYNGNWQPWYQWVIFFSYMAFNFDVSVNEALDWACSMQWGCPFFGVSSLQGNEGFTAIWPVWDGENNTFTQDAPNAQGLHSTLAVYGNGNIHLKNFQSSHMVAYPHVNGSQSVGVEDVAVFSVYSVDSFDHNVRYFFDWGDDTAQTVTDYTAAGVPVEVSHFWNTAGKYVVEVKVQCEDGTWSDKSVTYTVTVGTSYWLMMAVISLFLFGLALLVLVLWRHFKKHKKHV
ncbi:MAG: hypothetical protein LBH62_05715 [Nitrososphaerota archaeon]|jgi:hypothetical protein|nr:hypothetical protein [Nitrososphaerota archaeon]